MTTPVQRISRLLDEGARFMVQIPGHVSIDLTPDVIAAMAEVQMQREDIHGGLTCQTGHESSHKPG
ncbi:MAG: hypothetical protein ORN51_01865 [Akkermansiaceae bacterium]|nr:hypothetical protein [Akkermansiaceae bacterium]